MPSTADFTDQLRLADLRVTRPRLAVLEAVHAHPHADTDTKLPDTFATLIVAANNYASRLVSKPRLLVWHPLGVR